MSDGKIVISTELDSKPVEEGKKKIDKALEKIDISKLEKGLDNVTKSFQNTNAKIDLQKSKLEKLRESYEKATNVEQKNKIQEQILNTESGVIKLEGQLDKLGEKMVDLDSKISLAKAQQEIKNFDVETEKLSETTKQTEAPIKNMSDSISNSAKETQKLEKEMQKLKQVLGGEVPEATQKAYSNISKMNQEISSATRQFGSHSQQAKSARNALNDYALGLDDVTFKQVYMKSQLGLTDAQLNQQANSIKLNARMVSLMGSQTEILTKRMQGLKENGVKPSDLLPASTIGQFKMLNETIQASGNPIYKLSAGYRALGTSMEQTIKGWSAQKIAVKMAGDDMVKYGLILRGITAGQASLAMAFPIVGIAAVLAYSKIFSSAIQADEGLQKLAETAKGKLGEAFKPLLQVAGVVVKAFLDMTIKVADLMIKFNEAHPIISKVVAAIALLTPAMTLLLLPLNMGIGLFPGLAVAINQAWVAISGVAGAIGLASSTFLIFAAIIGTVVGAFMYLWQTNEGFKNAVLSAWSAISAKGKEVFGGLAKTFSTLSQAFSEGGFQGLLTAGSQIITNLIQGMSTALPQMIIKMNEVRMTILTAIASNLPQILTTGVQLITMFIQGIAQALPLIMNIGIQILTAILNTIVANLPLLINTGVTVLTTLLNGLIQALPVLISAGVQILTALVNAISQNLPQIINAGTQILNTLVDAITKLLPQIITAGVQMLVALIDGLSKAIPQLVAMLPTIIDTVVTVITKNLPIIIDAGIKVLVALINGLVKALPQLIAMLPQIITTIVTVISQNLPQIIDAGIQLLVAIITGLIQAIPQLVAAIPKIITAVKDGFAKVDWGTIGKNIISGISAGLENAKDALFSKASNIASSISKTIKNALDIHSPSRVMRDEVGVNIVRGISVGIDKETPTLTANIDSNISDLVSKLQSSVDYETARTTANVVVQNSGIYSQTGTNSNIENMDKLTSALNNLSKRPIQTSVEIDGETVVKATAEQSDRSSGKRLSFTERGLVL